MEEINLIWVEKFKTIKNKYENPTTIIQKYTEYCEKEVRKINERWKQHQQKCEEKN